MHAFNWLMGFKNVRIISFPRKLLIVLHEYMKTKQDIFLEYALDVSYFQIKRPDKTELV